MGQVDRISPKDRPGTPAGAVTPPVMTLFLLKTSDLGDPGETVVVTADDYALDQVLAGNAELVAANLSERETR